ncbi:MAG: Gldg family protein [Planctomycetes bacterium]|nr:Gldg family protein [Planctomycetota bacterium]
MEVNDMKAVSGTTKAATGANVAVMVAAAVAITIIINYLAAQSRFQTYFDWTRSGSNTLSDKSLGLLKEMPAKLGKDSQGRERAIEFVSFLNARSEAEMKGIEMIHQLVDVYKSDGSGRIAFSKFNGQTDINAIIAKLQELKIKDPAPQTLLIALGDRVRTIYLEDMVKIDRQRGGMFGGGEEGERIAENRIEDTITSNLLALLETEKPKAYFITGHGEADVDSGDRDGCGRFADTLRQSGYDVASLDLTEKGGVPADARVVIWISSSKPVPPGELAILKKYAHRGGRFIVALDPQVDPNADADMLKLLAEFAIKSPPGVVCNLIFDPLTGGAASGLPDCAEVTAVRYQDFSSAHPVTKSFFEQKLRVQFPGSRSFERILEGDSKAMVEDLARTNPKSWVDTPPFDFRWDEANEPQAAKSVLVAATLPNETDATTSAPADVNDKKSKEGRLIAFGSATLARNGGFPAGRDLLLSSVEWLAGREFAAGIGPKSLQKSAFMDTTLILSRIMGFSLILGGVAVTVAGLMNYIRRGAMTALIAGACVGAFPFLLGLYNLIVSSSQN